jgi:hypothetical protein
MPEIGNPNVAGVGGIQILRCQGFAVDYYAGVLLVIFVSRWFSAGGSEALRLVHATLG